MPIFRVNNEAKTICQKQILPFELPQRTNPAKVARQRAETRLAQTSSPFLKKNTNDNGTISCGTEYLI